MTEPKPKAMALRIVSVLFVTSGGVQIVVGFNLEGMVANALIFSGIMEIPMGAFFWFWADRMAR